MPAAPSPDTASFDYAWVRLVPRVEQGEFVNVGVILFCRTKGFLGARIHLDRERAVALMPPELDLETVAAWLDLIPRICQGAGPIGALPLPDRFHWLVSPRSTVIQPSPVHCGFCTDPAATLERLAKQLARGV